MTDILQYLLTATVFFLLYIAIRQGITKHTIASLTIGVIFILAGLTIQGIDGELLILSGIIIIILSLTNQEKEQKRDLQ